VAGPALKGSPKEIRRVVQGDRIRSGFAWGLDIG